MWQPTTLTENVSLNGDWQNKGSYSEEFDSLLDISAPDLSYLESSYANLNNSCPYTQPDNSSFEQYSTSPQYYSTASPQLNITESSLSFEGYCDTYSDSGCSNNSFDYSNSYGNYLSLPDITVNNQSSTGLLKEMEIFKMLPITQWEGKHCLDWGASVCKENNIDITTTNIASLANLTGTQLITLKERNFCKITDDIVGPLLHKNMKAKRHQLRKAAVNMSTSGATKNEQFLDMPSTSGGGMSPLHMPDFDSILNDVMLETESAFDIPLMHSDDDTNDDCDNLLENISQINLNDYDLPEILLRDTARSLSPSYYDSNSRDVSPGNMIYTLSPSATPCQSPRDISPFANSTETGLQASSSNLLQVPHKETVRPRRRRVSSGNKSVTSDSPCGSLKTSNNFLKKIPSGPRNSRQRSPKSWEFLVRLLINPISNPALIKWEDEANGVFRLIKKDEIARIWADRATKDTRPKHGSYESFARILRHHYKTGALMPVSEKHLVYKFSEAVMEDIKNGQCQ